MTGRLTVKLFQQFNLVDPEGIASKQKDGFLTLSYTLSQG